MYYPDAKSRCVTIKCELTLKSIHSNIIKLKESSEYNLNGLKYKDDLFGTILLFPVKIRYSEFEEIVKSLNV